MNGSRGTFLHHYVTKLLQIHLFAVPASQMLTLEDQYIALQYDDSCLYLIKCPLHCGHWKVRLDKRVRSILAEVRGALTEVNAVVCALCKS